MPEAVDESALWSDLRQFVATMSETHYAGFSMVLLKQFKASLRLTPKQPNGFTHHVKGHGETQADCLAMLLHGCNDLMEHVNGTLGYDAAGNTVRLKSNSPAQPGQE